MRVLEENLQVLASHHPEAAAAIERTDKGGARVLVRGTSSGAPTATLEGIHLHSRYDPLRDARKQVERDMDPSSTAIIVLGFGLGYGAETARKLFPELPLLVVEPDPEVFYAALSCRDLRQLLADPSLFLYLDEEPEGLPRVLETLPLARPCFLRLRPAIQAAPARYRAAEELIHSWLLRRDINVNTLNRFGRLWVRNLCRNIRAFVDCAGVASLADLFAGIPALVVAGGPSLDEVGPCLPELRERMLVVAVNTPLKACVARGAEPDFAVVVDPQYWASRYLDWASAPHCLFVAEPSACPRVFHGEAGPFFLCGSLFPLGETLEAAVGQKGKLGAGGSVSTSAWDFARMLGARPLYAAGLDLGFPGMRTHCRGVYAEELWFSLSGRLDPVEGSSFRSVRDIGLFAVRSTGGGRVPTDRRMLLYKWWFENQLQMRPEVLSYTLSPGGAAIEGMPLADLSQVLALPPLRPEIERRMAKARDIHLREASRERTESGLRSSIAELAIQLGELEALSRRGSALSRELGGIVTKRKDADECLRELDDIDAGILSLSARTIAGFLIPSLIHEISGQGGRAGSPEEVISRSTAMYEGIAESAAWQKGLLRKTAESLEQGGRPERGFP